MINAITLNFNKYTSKEKHNIINDPTILGMCVRTVRETTYMTVFMDSEDAFLYVLKHAEVIDIILVPFLPAMCADKNKIATSHFEERAKNYSITLHGTF